MLSSINLNKELSKSEYKERYDQLEKELIKLQREIIAVGMPVLIAFEGWSASGKGTLINELSLPMDPRGFRVYEGRHTDDHITYLKPFWDHSPGKGLISIFDRSWYRPGIEKIFSSGEQKRRHLKDALNFEEHHLNSDTLVIKFFLHISQETQSARLKELTSEEVSSWRVTEEDFKQNFHYDEFRDVCDFVIEESNDLSEWEIIEAEDFHHAKIKVISTVVERLKKALEKPCTAGKPSSRLFILSRT